MSLLTEKFKRLQPKDYQESDIHIKSMEDAVKEIKEHFENDETFAFDSIPQKETNEEEFKSFIRSANTKTISPSQFKHFVITVADNKLR